MGQSFCINKNVCRFGFVPVIPVSPDATLKERCLGQSQWMLCCLKYCDLETRRNFKYFSKH